MRHGLGTTLSPHGFECTSDAQFDLESSEQHEREVFRDPNRSKDQTVSIVSHGHSLSLLLIKQILTYDYHLTTYITKPSSIELIRLNHHHPKTWPNQICVKPKGIQKSNVNTPTAR